MQRAKKKTHERTRPEEQNKEKTRKRRTNKIPKGQDANVPRDRTKKTRKRRTNKQLQKVFKYKL